MAISPEFMATSNPSSRKTHNPCVRPIHAQVADSQTPVRVVVVSTVQAPLGCSHKLPAHECYISCIERTAIICAFKKDHLI